MEPGLNISTAVTAVRALFKAYSSYEKGKLAHSDQSLREEVRRRSRMIREHLEPLHDDAHREGAIKLRERVVDVINLCDKIGVDAIYTASHTPDSEHIAQANLNKAKLKELVSHDLATLEKLVACTRLVNETSHIIGTESDEEKALVKLNELRQDLTGARNHFRERNMLLDGLTAKR